MDGFVGFVWIVGVIMGRDFVYFFGNRELIVWHIAMNSSFVLSFFALFAVLLTHSRLSGLFR